MKIRIRDFTQTVAGFRMAIYLTLSLVALVLPIPNRAAVAAVLAVTAVAIWPLESLTTDPHRAVIAMMQDLLVAVAIAIMIPELWNACILAVVAISTWSILRSESPLQRPVAMLTTTLMVLVGVLQRPPGWLAVCAVAVVLSGFFNVLSLRRQGQLRDREDDLAQALSTSGAIVHISDLIAGRVESMDGPIKEITGWTAEQWTTLNHRDLVHPEDRDAFWIDETDVVEGNVVDRKGRFQRADGSYAWLRDVSRIVRADGRLKLRGISMDVTEIEQAHALIRHQAETDALTGLANRSVLTTELERWLEEARDFGLVLLDLDRFKNVNDTLGHGFGDSVLIEIAKRLATMAGEDDIVVRLGGDEFAVLVPELRDDEAASTLAQEIAVECSRVMSLQGVTISSGASIGIAMSPRDGDSVQTLLSHADIAMYAAKRERRSFQIFNTDIQQAPLEEVTLSAAIGAALERSEFELHFQPKINTQTGVVTGFEGLARWQHPTFGLLTPNRFMHLVKLSNFDTAFTDRVLDLGAQFAALCASDGNPVPVSVNISARSLYDDTFPDRVSRAMDRFGLTSDQLVIEITEHDIMNRSAGESGMLDRLDALGVALSIDDFGTGYSSLARLIDLPVSEIKIDRRFIAKLLEDERDAIVVRSIIDLGRNLNLHVVAEGIERQAEADYLSAWGCDHAQGFLYSKAVPAAQARRQLQEGTFSSIGTGTTDHAKNQATEQFAPEQVSPN